MTKGITPIFSTNSKKYLMVKKATTEEIEKPTKSCKRSISTPGAIISSKRKTRAPNIVGIPSKNANLDASLRLKPAIKPAVIAVPDLDAPGIKAKT